MTRLQLRTPLNDNQASYNFAIDIEFTTTTSVYSGHVFCHFKNWRCGQIFLVSCNIPTCYQKMGLKVEVND